MQVTRPSIDVLVFDSGLGGLSVLSAMQAALPHLRYAYLADNAALPYGDKPEAWLVERVSEVVGAALREVQPRLLVIACNTASTLVLPRLRAEWQLPIVGVVPAIKPAAELSRSRVIGLLATPGTIHRPYTDSLIREYAQDCEVIRVGSSALVGLAEGKLRGKAIDLDQLAEICRPLRASEADVVVLGCTHFPLLSEELAEVLPGVRLLDSGSAIARRVSHLLGKGSYAEEKALSKEEQPAFFTARDSAPLAAMLASYGLGQVQTLPQLTAIKVL